MADADAPQQDAPPERECVVRHRDTRGVLNTKIYAAPFEASPNETMATYPADLMDSPLHVTQQRAVLKTLATSFQREIKAIFEDDGSFASQICKSSRHLVNNAKKRVFGVNQAALPHYFYSKIRGIEDTRWELFFTQRILVSHNHFCEGGRGPNLNLCL
jgi:hypothetical protein